MDGWMDGLDFSSGERLHSGFGGAGACMAKRRDQGLKVGPECRVQVVGDPPGPEHSLNLGRLITS
jgi:hypothetical protein